MFKVEVDTEGLGSYAPQMIFGGLLAVAVVVYIAGVMTHTAILPAFAFGIAVIDVVGYIFFKRHSSGGARDYDIDEEVDRFRADLIDTFTGYDVEPTKEEVDRAVADYRRRLEEDSTPMSDIDLATMSKVVLDGLRRKGSKKDNGRDDG